MQTGLWRWNRGTGLERFELLHAENAWRLHGTILTLAGMRPVEVRYEIQCDGLWQTRHADISLHDGKVDRALQISAENGRWYANGNLHESVNGCLDIDLGWSPSTNTLPIRRLDLDVGQSSGEIVAAWIRFPELELTTLLQEYRRISERQYRYSSRGGAFVAQISVDHDGLVTDYEGFWQRVNAEQ